MSTSALKTLALILMLTDHIGEFFPKIIPVWFRWLGRLSAPLFIFCLTIGFSKTRSRRKYVFRLLISSFIMTLGNYILVSVFPQSPVRLNNNIFATMTLITLIIWMIESFQEEYARPDRMKYPKASVLAFAVSQIGGILLSKYFGCPQILPNVLLCEGRINVVLLGVVMYFCRNSRRNLSVFYLLYCGCELFASMDMACTYGNITMIFTYFYQWMMAASLPLMLCYNGEKGKSHKAFFYLFYPLHIWSLFTLANILA